MQFLRLALTALCVLCTGLAKAQPIPGADAPAYAAARDQWLAGEDLAALQALGDLARADNTAAQMLLSAIASASYTHAHLTTDMPRRERIALLRQEGGLSGRDWLQRAAEHHPLADALLNSRGYTRDVEQTAQFIWTLLSHNARREAYAQIRRVLDHGHRSEALTLSQTFQDALGAPGISLYAWALDMASFSQPVPVPRHVRTREEFTAYLSSLRTPMVRLESYGPWGASQGETLEERRLEQENVIRPLIDIAPSLAPLHPFCAQRCPESQSECRYLTAVNLEIYPYPFQSPLPALISNEAYQASARFFRDIEGQLAISPTARYRLDPTSCQFEN